MAEGIDEPSLKRQKTDNRDTERMNVFKLFLEDENKLRILKTAYNSMLEGSSGMSVCVLKLLETNARLSEGFSHAFCKANVYEKAGSDPPMVQSYAIGSIFRVGLFILREFLNSKNPGVPKDHKQQEALINLLKFMNMDHSALKCDEGSWAVRIAQHLLYPLSTVESYIIDDNYKALDKYASKCPCKAGHSLDGTLGDTSFGWIDGWHGRADILVDDVVVDFTNSTFGVNSLSTDEDLELSSSSVSTSLTSTETDFVERDKQQIIAQTIVFSFLQCKESNGVLKHFLVPGIGISKKKVISYLYDCENDVLLGTPPMELFAYKSLCYNTIVFLWLTLNYKIFCSGITDSMKPFKAEFFERVGSFLENYRNDVARRVHKRQRESENEAGWSLYPCETTILGEDLGIETIRLGRP